MQKVKLGDMLCHAREQWNITKEQLSNGLCSVSSLNNYENNVRTPDSLLFHYFMMRLGQAPEHYAIMLKKEEYAYYIWKERTLKTLYDQDWNKLEHLLEEKEAVEVLCNEPIQQQYFHYLKAIIAAHRDQNERDAALHLEQAARQTIPDTADTAQLLLGTDELEILLLFFYYGTHSGYLTERQQQYVSGMLRKYMENEIRDEDEQARIYPRFVCIYLHLKGEEIPLEERLMLCRKAVTLLKKTYALYDLPEVLHFFVNALKEIHSKETIYYEKQYQALLDVYEYFEIDASFRPEVFYGRKPKMYLVHEYLKIQRQFKGMTQQEVSEGICEPENYSRMENGKRTPSRNHFHALAERLEIPWGYYRGELVTDNYKAYQLRIKAHRLISKSEWEKAEEVFQKLEQMLDMTEAVNRQYIESMRTDMQSRKGEISAEKAILQFKKELELTLKENVDEADLYYYSITELAIQANIAKGMSRCGEEKQAVIRLEKLFAQLKRSDIPFEFQWNGISFLLTTLSLVYFQDGQYEKSLEAAQYECQISMKKMQADTIPFSLDAIADDLEHMGGEHGELCDKLYRDAVYISDFFEMNVIGVKNYYEEAFCPDYKWYEE